MDLTPHIVDAYGSENAQKIINLEKEFICRCCNNEEEARDHEIILGFYVHSINESGKIPSLEDIEADVSDYNYGILFEIAEIQYNTEYKHDKHDNNQKKEEVISDIVNNWFEYYYEEVFAFILEYVEDVLNFYDLEFWYDVENRIYSYLDLDSSYVMVSANNSQNILFGEFFYKEIIKARDCSHVENLMILGL